MDKIYVMKLENGASLEVRAAPELELKARDVCVFHRDFFDDLGEICRECASPAGRPEDLPVVKTLASEADLAAANANLSKARSAIQTARNLVSNLGLQMKLVNAHYSLDGKLLTIQFCADGRVDFRELVKELSRSLSTRIELRQIGVRDETGVYGGIAVCGRELCCCKFLKEFSSINVKMAKEQDLSLTPSTISGVCGRLKCCLKYEHDGYLELERGMPRKGEFCDTPSGRGRVCDRNLLTRKVMLVFEGGSTSIFDCSEVTVVPQERRPNNNNNSNGGGNGKNRLRPPRRNDKGENREPKAGRNEPAASEDKPNNAESDQK